jgi:hypothetical protein
MKSKTFLIPMTWGVATQATITPQPWARTCPSASIALVQPVAGDHKISRDACAVELSGSAHSFAAPTSTVIDRNRIGSSMSRSGPWGTWPSNIRESPGDIS